MIYIGIDPEPSGAWCLWRGCKDPQYDEEVIFYTNFADPEHRANQFIDVMANHYKGLANSRVGHIYIEDAWIRPHMNAVAMSKYVRSFGEWLGILYAVGFTSKQINIIPASTWKKGLFVTEDKLTSYDLTRKLIEDPEQSIDVSCLNQLKLAPDCPEKQIFDRCEAFLIAYYGRFLYDGNNHPQED